MHGQPEDRRPPHVARVIEASTTLEDRERRERERIEDARYPAMDAPARALLLHFERGEIVGDPDDDLWWSELAEVVDDRRDTFERANLASCVRGAVREPYGYARRSGKSPAGSAAGKEVLAAAAALVGEELLASSGHQQDEADEAGGQERKTHQQGSGIALDPPTCLVLQATTDCSRDVILVH
ncbi:hypothetical protein [Streptomyces sp. NPDC093223]|uniref:hypothetical protein n=1 Tax=Streptomyces sp. NPDC093223 TaxID=3366033 RepID=UPI00380350F6